MENINRLSTHCPQTVSIQKICPYWSENREPEKRGESGAGIPQKKKTIETLCLQGFSSFATATNESV
jgi:hypothetical protein